MKFSIRNVSDSDLHDVLRLNEAVIPAVNSLSLEKMRWFANQAPYFRIAVNDGALGAFLIGLRQGIDYESLNYRWFCEHYKRFGYIDRIAVAADARRQGLASEMYDDFQATLSDDVPVMACEVNLRPPNPGSMRFHMDHGFQQVGAQSVEGGEKEVALMIKPL